MRARQGRARPAGEDEPGTLRVFLRPFYRYADDALELDEEIEW